VLLYLIGKNVLSVPPAAPAQIELQWGDQRCH
jgi:hypothetical protein